MLRQVRPTPEIPDMEVLRQIGGGSYGEIWMARSVTDTLRAVKVVYRNDFEDDRTFEREFEGILKYEPIAREHPGLVDILHVGRARTGKEEFYFYVMELGDDVERGSEIRPADYESRTLRSDMLRSGKRPLAVSFCAEAGARVAGALAHLHERGLAHRDVKPANIIFIKGKACLADIGLVAARDQRTFVGTEGFVPPEGPGSAEADVYSLGKVLYEMATGKDRLDFPELPDEPIAKAESKRWLILNKVICETCDGRLKKRKYTDARELERVLLLMAQSRKIEKKSSPVGLLGTLMVVLAVLAGALFLPKNSITIQSTATPEEAVPTISFLTVTSIPEGAEVYDDEGEQLGVTPFGPKDYPIGAEVQFELRLQGYESATLAKSLDEADEIVLVTLNRYPPELGFEWQDFLTQRYFPEPDGSHLTAYLVGPNEYRSLLGESAGELGVVTMRENSKQREAVFVTTEQAQDFVSKLAGESHQRGVAVEKYRFSVEPARAVDYPDLPAEKWTAGLRPFRVRVSPIRPATIDLISEPAGAFVYFNDDYQGLTPLEGLELPPGDYRLRVELDGYEQYESVVELQDEEILILPKVILAATKGMPWQSENWENTLGMELIELSEGLLGARWETRVRDFRQFVDAQKIAFPDPPKFTQGPNHPVVNVTREEAADFCKWLTAKERAEGRIQEWHEYRLPTDSEWSQMAGLEVELGDTPRDRASIEVQGFPWGEDFPPVEKVANIAGIESSVFAPFGSLLPDYDDGFAYTAPVGQFPANGLGFHDLGGNVREWVSDYYTSEEEGYQTTRGGSWQDYREEHLRTGARRLSFLDTGEAYGFRVVLAKLEPVEDNPFETENENDG